MDRIGIGRIGPIQIYLHPFGRQGAQQKISIDGGTQARWRSDDTELFYIAPDGRLMAVPIRTSSKDQPIGRWRGSAALLGSRGRR